MIRRPPPQGGLSVRAGSRQDAEKRALDAWKNTEFVLDDFDDFEGINVEALDDGADDDGTLPYDTVSGGYGSESPEERGSADE